MKCSVARMRVYFDIAFDCIPGLSTLNTFIDLGQKNVFKHYQNPNVYHQRILHKKKCRLLTLAIPVIGQIVVGIYTLAKPFFKVKPKVMIPPTHSNHPLSLSTNTQMSKVEISSHLSDVKIPEKQEPCELPQQESLEILNHEELPPDSIQEEVLPDSIQEEAPLDPIQEEPLEEAIEPVLPDSVSASSSSDSEIEHKDVKLPLGPRMSPRKGLCKNLAGEIFTKPSLLISELDSTFRNLGFTKIMHSTEVYGFDANDYVCDVFFLGLEKKSGIDSLFSPTKSKQLVRLQKHYEENKDIYAPHYQNFIPQLIKNHLDKTKARKLIDQGFQISVALVYNRSV